MIQSIALENFQSHPATAVDFHPGVNVIIGPSDKGKSALLRGLYWVLTNRPSGDSIWSDWNRGEKGGRCSVKITTPEGSVERVRTKSLNAYLVDGVQMEAVGMDVPAEVGTLLNLSEVNIQRQMDAPFLLSATPGEVARFLNGILHLEEIDRMLSAMDSRKKRTAARLKEETARAADLAERIKTTAWVPEAEVMLKIAEDVAASLAETHQRAERLAGVIAEYRRMSEAREGACKLADLAPKVKYLRATSGMLAEARRDLNNLTSATATAAQAAGTIARTSRLANFGPYARMIRDALKEREGLVARGTTLGAAVKQGEALRAAVARAGAIAELSAEAERVHNIGQRVMDRKALINQLQLLINRGMEAQEQVAAAGARRAELVAKRPEVCPLCGGPMNSTDKAYNSKDAGGHDHG